MHTFLSMLFPVLLCLIPHVLSMNEISALGHAALWKKYGLKNAPSAVIAKVETAHSSPSRAIDNQQVPCFSWQPCASSPDQLPSVPHTDTPESIEMEPFEEQRDLSSSPVMSCAYHPDIPRSLSLKCSGRVSRGKDED